ncbi:DoxX family protein [Myxococcus stipitatus]|uniref:DoxX family protein n=1 Tax=Myxococcus stipitatus TaxID=83455 RepID=UPI001F4759B0|nr:DoxX family protein [Myxococcus stipitatus]MCE9668102.1 DoxX family protein [Myxococcus stipitatus]
MEPFIALVAVTLVLHTLGTLGVERLRPWVVPVRGGLATMFLMTGGAHFIGMREELIRMVPPLLPAPGFLVTLTGVLELVGAVGLLWRRTAPLAAACLSVLLVAVFPANVYAALAGVTTQPHQQLLPRTAMQLVFLAATLSVVVHDLRARRQVPSLA